MLLSELGDPSETQSLANGFILPSLSYGLNISTCIWGKISFSQKNVNTIFTLRKCVTIHVSVLINQQRGDKP